MCSGSCARERSSKFYRSTIDVKSNIMHYSLTPSCNLLCIDNTKHDSIFFTYELFLLNVRLGALIMWPYVRFRSGNQLRIPFDGVGVRLEVLE